MDFATIHSISSSDRFPLTPTRGKNKKQDFSQWKPIFRWDFQGLSIGWSGSLGLDVPQLLAFSRVPPRGLRLVQWPLDPQRGEPQKKEEAETEEEQEEEAEEAAAGAHVAKWFHRYSPHSRSQGCWRYKIQDGQCIHLAGQRKPRCPLLVCESVP